MTFMFDFDFIFWLMENINEKNNKSFLVRALLIVLLTGGRDLVLPNANRSQSCFLNPLPGFKLIQKKFESFTFTSQSVDPLQCSFQLRPESSGCGLVTTAVHSGSCFLLP